MLFRSEVERDLAPELRVRDVDRERVEVAVEVQNLGAGEDDVPRVLGEDAGRERERRLVLPACRGACKPLSD